MGRLRGLLLILFCCNSIFLSFGQIPKALRTETLRARRGFHWNVEHSSHFDYYFESGSPASRDIAAIEARFEHDYSHIVTLLGDKEANLHVDAFIVDSRARMKQLCGHESNGLAVGNVILFVYGDSIKALGAHEPTHLLSQFLWGTPHGVWLTEGLAVYADDEWQALPLHGICKQLNADRKLIPISSLFDDHQFRRSSEMVTYPEAGSFMKFLYERYGRDAVKALWTQGAESIPKVFGESLTQLESEWFAVINSTSGATGYKTQ